MHLNYSSITMDSMGRPEVPELVLQTLSGETIGYIKDFHDLSFNIKLSELSEMNFKIARYNNGVENPLYSKITGYKLIKTEHLGEYLVMNPSEENEGIEAYKTVTCYSTEKQLEKKRFFLQEGTYNFWNPADQEDTIFGVMLKSAHGWKPGYVSPTLIGKYRTFSDYNDFLLPFAYSTAPDLYNCIFVFDPYAKEISVYDVNEEIPSLPIFIGFDNLTQSIDTDELSDEIITALHPTGADGLETRAVNPTGSNFIYDLSYFIENGDIPSALAEKWKEYQLEIQNNRPLHTGIAGLMASLNARIMSAEANIIEMNKTMDNLKNQQSATIQSIANEKDKKDSGDLDGVTGGDILGTTEDGKTEQEKLDEINRQIEILNKKISDAKDAVAVDNELANGDSDTSYKSQIEAINNTLSLEAYFSEDELSILHCFFIEDNFSDETFVSTDIVDSGVDSVIAATDSTVNVSDSVITKLPLPTFNKNMYTISKGILQISGKMSMTAEIIRGTAEVNDENDVIMSLYVGAITVNDVKADSGTITVSGRALSVTDNTTEITVDEVLSIVGSEIEIVSPVSKTADDNPTDDEEEQKSLSIYVTTNVSEYQTYSVQTDLYEHAVSVLKDISSPTYEFSIKSTNFLFAKGYEQFKNKLKLGSGIYVQLDANETICPAVIEVEFNFEDISEMSLIFSNRFKRHDAVNTLKDMIESSYSSSSSFDASKYTYGKTSNKMSQVSEFMNSSIDASVNKVIGSTNQTVIIDGSGIEIGGASDNKIRIVDSMIAMTDDNWQHAKMAIGNFTFENTDGEAQDYWGVNAEIIGGNLIIGNNLVIENENDDGVMQFKVDASGAWLNNSTFVLQSDATGDDDTTSGGKILIDPKYGIAAGNGNLYSTEGTTVTPIFVGDDGKITYDDQGMPSDTNFYLDMDDGNAYFRGTVNALSGSIGGWDLKDDVLSSGKDTTYVAINSSETIQPLYAMWAGDEDPTKAKFSVKRDGTLSAEDGVFKGVVQATDFKNKDGKSMLTEDDQIDSEYLNLKGLTITNDKGAKTLEIDQDGNIELSGDIVFTDLPDDIAGAIPDDDDIATVITDELISSPKIKGAVNLGGFFVATGRGVADEGAFYIYDGEPDVHGNKTSGYYLDDSGKKGYISFDNSGDGTTSEAQERVLFNTEPGVALKINSGSGMSLSAGSRGNAGYIWIESGTDIRLVNDRGSWVSVRDNLGSGGSGSSTAVFG